MAPTLPTLWTGASMAPLEGDPDGPLKSQSSMWLVRGQHLLKCWLGSCATPLKGSTSLKNFMILSHNPGTPRVAKELGRNDFDHLSEKPPSREELRRAADPGQEEHQASD